ncbi:hypothetical protein TRAPUB_9224 [Trametes pubescens]|uniref:Uncharacterized protein n=1 Tax=Trametes pubescens TaxID=154538 RepID=A0A1M2W2T4_TRAPU|nr:hypothetical protein TRAPUB_9224 [Trametes pubescens]
MTRPAKLESSGREVEARMWQTANASDASPKARHGALALFGSRGYPDRALDPFTALESLLFYPRSESS